MGALGVFFCYAAWTPCQTMAVSNSFNASHFISIRYAVLKNTLLVFVVINTLEIKCKILFICYLEDLGVQSKGFFFFFLHSNILSVIDRCFNFFVAAVK